MKPETTLFPLTYSLRFPPDERYRESHWEVVDDTFSDADEARDAAWELSLASDCPVWVFETFGQSENLYEIVAA